MGKRGEGLVGARVGDGENRKERGGNGNDRIVMGREREEGKWQK